MSSYFSVRNLNVKYGQCSIQPLKKAGEYCSRYILCVVACVLTPVAPPLFLVITALLHDNRIQTIYGKMDHIV